MNYDINLKGLGSYIIRLSGCGSSYIAQSHQDFGMVLLV